MYNEKRIKQSELLQLILLDSLYAQSGSHRIIFQGGTALRWGYNGMRFSEDLDFVTDLSEKAIEKILSVTIRQTERACVAQFGPGQSEYKSKKARKQSTKGFFIYRPQKQRERIAVKLEFEMLKAGHAPAFNRFILRDLPLVGGMIAQGNLILPYSSSIILIETPEEILSDKIRALYEREYLKGRDIYDIWWICGQLKIVPDWISVSRKLSMYQVPFIPARNVDCFQKEGAASLVIEALKTDLSRFLPESMMSIYQDADFVEFVKTLERVTLILMDQGMSGYFETHGRKRVHA